jgi:hypothetical protein
MMKSVDEQILQPGSDLYYSLHYIIPSTFENAEHEDIQNNNFTLCFVLV